LIGADRQVKTAKMHDPMSPSIIADPPADIGAEVAGALAWWRAAGVDADFHDEPTHWLADVESAQASASVRRPPSAPAPPAEPQRPAIDRAAWPHDLAEFAAWWLSDPALDDGRVTGRVAPRGPAQADFMIVVPEPERDDRDHLLAGPQGKLLEAMLTAMGIATDRAYVASALPRNVPMADWAALAEKGIGALLNHHIALVAPQRLIVLGSNLLPLMGHDPAHNPAVLRTFNHEGLTIPLLAGKSLAALLERPRWKAGLWQGWLDWTGT
jgi:DNA polymerase